MEYYFQMLLAHVEPKFQCGWAIFLAGSVFKNIGK